ncbi:MAG: iron transporter [Flavobacteriales bacterium]|nr:Nramp family divalent metal transporter [Flavobacteriales bacterium]MBQ19256.1 iron transporter [Flavobacteriales bacterium]|tara:strand:+ start:3641 stop:4879 length:1239 start_codon:yes stop_codon:yes gene_type:complete
MSWHKKLGPGLLYAGAAIGVSHLIQSTRAGSDFGYQLIWAILIVIILKYPFFEYGPRYAAITGKNILYGYKNLGKWSVILFFLITFFGMFIIQSTVTTVTAGIVAEVFHIHLPIWSIASLVLFICCLFLFIGKYKVLDTSMKFIISLLAIATISTFLTSLFGDYQQNNSLKTIFSFSNKNHILFLIALMGWMPAPFDIAVWHSIWTTEKTNHNKDTSISYKDIMFDFKLGYWTTLILAIAFLGLGAVSIYGTGVELSANGSEFTKQLLQIYTSNIGEWSYIIIAAAALTTMFSTTLTCLDAQPRVMVETSAILFNKTQNEATSFYWLWLFLLAFGSIVIIAFFSANMKMLIDFATAIAFLSSPILAILNYLVITGKDIPKEKQPSTLLKTISIIGILFFVCFSIYYFYVYFF